MRHLTESATPFQVMATDEKLRTVRLCWAMAQAWEAGHLAAGGNSRAGEFHPDNPYVAQFDEAVLAYEQHRRQA
jgi:hypothetical protein